MHALFRIVAAPALAFAVAAGLAVPALPASAAVVDTDIITTIAGTGAFSRAGVGDGRPAVDAEIDANYLAAAPAVSPWAGSVFFTEEDRVRRIAPDGRIELFAGGGDGFTEGEPARDAFLGGGYGLRGIDVADDGTVYVLSAYGPDTIFRISPAGTVHTHVYSSSIYDSEGIALANNGDIYVASAATTPSSG